MDLYAYAQIDRLDRLAEANGISVPRLRGYRWMKEEKALTKEEIEETVQSNILSYAESFFRSRGHGWIEFSRWTDLFVNYYMDVDEKKNPVSIRWDHIHGKKRKKIKYLIKCTRKNTVKQLETFNKYAGREDVLYIHSRIGGNNWNFYNGDKEIIPKSWFLEKVDDAFDSTYCDIYAKLTQYHDFETENNNTESKGE